MAIAEIATSTPGQPNKGPDCMVCRALVELPEADAAGLRLMLSDKTRRFAEIAALVSADEDTPAWVRSIAQHTYRRHARGQCSAREVMR
jgi:hypothetical protein